MTTAQIQFIPIEKLPKTGRLLGVDVGSKWIGLAVSDSGQVLAAPRQAKQRGKWLEDKSFFENLAKEEKIVGLVVGLPLTLKGAVGPAADAARSYADLLSAHLNLPTVMWDERMTTVAAEKTIFEARTAGSRQTRMNKKSTKAFVDSAAAVLILQMALDSQRRL